MAREDVDAHGDFAALFQSGQEVVAQMRKVQEQRRSEAGAAAGKAG
jgi:hypothetical protein